MKKFYSLIAALLLAGGIMAGELVFTAADFSGKGAASPGAAMEVTKQGVTVAVNLGLGSGTDIRVFAGSTLTVTADVNILKITPEFASNNKMTFDPVQPNATSWSITATKQIRLSKLTVEVDKEVTPEADPVNLGPKTIAEFIDLANTKDTCVITGKVVYPGAGGLKGDVNGDGVVDMADISAIISAMASDKDKKADVNEDGTIDVADIFTVLTIMVGGETSGKE